MSSFRDPILNVLWGSADMMGGAVGGVSKGAYQAVKDKIQETYTTKNKPEYDMEVGAIYQDYYEKMVAIQTIQSVASQFLEGDERKTLNADLNKAAQRASFDLLSAEYVESSGKGETSLNPQSAALAGMFIQKQMGTEQAGKYVKFLPMIDAAIPDDYRMAAIITTPNGIGLNDLPLGKLCLPLFLANRKGCHTKRKNVCYSGIAQSNYQHPYSVQSIVLLWQMCTC